MCAAYLLLHNTSDVLCGQTETKADACLPIYVPVLLVLFLFMRVICIMMQSLH